MLLTFLVGEACTMLWGYRITQISNTQITSEKVVYSVAFGAFWVDSKIQSYLPHKKRKFLGIIESFFPYAQNKQESK